MAGERAVVPLTPTQKWRLDLLHSKYGLVRTKVISQAIDEVLDKLDWETIVLLDDKKEG